MTPAARLQAAIEILDEVIASARDDGPPADAIVTRYFKHAPLRRIEGPPSGARAGVPRDPALRRTALRAGARQFSGLAEDEPALLELFGEPRGPEPPKSDGEEIGAEPGLVPDWLVSELSPLVGEDEWPALLERAPLDLRVNAVRASRDDLLDRVSRAQPRRRSARGASACRRTAASTIIPPFSTASSRSRTRAAS